MVDEEMEVAPHLLPPPNFVDADGMIYPDEIQRLVPGHGSLQPVCLSLYIYFIFFIYYFWGFTVQFNFLLPSKVIC